MLTRHLVAAFVTALIALSPCAATESPGGFGGIEFFGSPDITRFELEKELGLKQGAKYEGVVKAVDRLKQRLDKKNIDALVDIVSEGDEYYVCVDVRQQGATGIPLRKLEAPHKVYLASELPFTTLAQLFTRIEELHQQGKTVGETFPQGIKEFSDEPCNQYAKKLLTVVPMMRGQFFELLASDPDPERRSMAIEALNWDPRVARNCADLIPAVDDGAERVRASADRYIYPRIKMLPDNFPISDLVEALSHQLGRPSNIDRTLSLRCLAEIARCQPFSIRAIQEVDGERLKQFESLSLLSSIKQPAAALLHAVPVAQPPKSRNPVQLNEF